MEFPLVRKTITLEKMQAYTGTAVANIHTDPEMASRFGLRGAIAQGSHLTTFLNEVLVTAFGKEYLNGGSIAVNFIKMVRPGDTVTAHAKVASAVQLDSGATELELQIWIENQVGETTTAGTARLVTRRDVTAS